MKTLQTQISDQDYSRYNFQKKCELTFAELEELISLEYAKRALLKCNEIGEMTGLSKMSIEEIDAEIKVVRNSKSK